MVCVLLFQVHLQEKPTNNSFSVKIPKKNLDLIRKRHFEHERKWRIIECERANTGVEYFRSELIVNFCNSRRQF